MSRRSWTRAPRILPRVNQPGDPFERSADQLASDALRADPAPAVPVQLAALDAAPAAAAVDLGTPGAELEPETRRDMEARFRHDFSRVRVHYGGGAADSALALGTRAYTLGHSIVFGAGAYAPGTHAGRELLAHELAHVVQQTGTVGTLGRPAAGVAQGRHLSIPEAVKAFQSKVDQSKEPAGTTPSIAESGQFYWTNQIGSAVRYTFNTVLNDPSWDATEKADLLRDFNGLMAAISMYEPKEQATHHANVWKHLKATKNPLKRQLEALLVDRSGLSGEDVAARLWQFRNSKEMSPDLRPYMNVPMYDKVHAAEAVACGKTAGLAISRFKTHGGFEVSKDEVPAADLKLKGRSYAVGKGIKRHPVSTAVPTGDITYFMGDEVTYGGDLASAIADVKRALDAGLVVNTRVVSGYGVSGPPRLRTEHSIVIIGYDGWVFAFWDPDAGASQILGPGFGYLFHSGGRFGTGGGDNETFRCDARGDHAGGGQHRYQVVTMTIT